MPSIKFWYFPGACSIAPHIVLKELGVPFEPIRMRLENGAVPESFRTINSKMKVPVLSIDGQIITEIPAIMTALSQLAPERKVLGGTDMDVVRSYEWMNWLSGSLHGQGYGPFFRSDRYSEDESMHTAIREKALKTILGYYDIIEDKLSGKHAVGDSFSVVDTYLYVFWRWGATQLDMAAKYPKYAKLVNELLGNSAVQGALKAEEVESYAPKL